MISPEEVLAILIAAGEYWNDLNEGQQQALVTLAEEYGYVIGEADEDGYGPDCYDDGEM